jgi:hypothetical protein
MAATSTKNRKIVENRTADLPRRHRAILLLLLGAVLLVNWASFSSAALRGFGYTRTFTTIAETSLRQGAYMSTAEGMTNGIVQGPGFDQPQAETQREPLYPAFLMAAASTGLPDGFAVAVELACLAVACLLILLMCLSDMGMTSTALTALLLAFSPVCFFYAQVLYPYAFSMLGVVVAIYGLRKGDQGKGGYGNALLAAVGMACAIYERGNFMLLPFFLAAAGLLITPKSRRKHALKYMMLFLAATFLLIAPWLARNAAYGIHGMNQIAGYVLGYTYGGLPGASADPAYDRLVAANGSDAGSLSYIGQRMRDSHETWAMADKHLAALMADKIKASPQLVAHVIASNLWHWDTGLFHARPMLLQNGLLQPGGDDVLGYFQRQTHGARWVNHAVFVLFLAGLWPQARQRRPLAIYAVALLAYSLLIIAPLVILDPRYRGPLDLFIYAYAGAGLAQLFRLACRNARNYGQSATAQKTRDIA